MTETDSAIAGRIWGAWRSGTLIEGLSGDAPRSRVDGYRIQAHLESHSAHPRAGWKIAATSEAGQSHINVDGPLAGRILVENIVPDGAEVSLSGNRMRVAEPEFAFRFGQSVPARTTAYGQDEIMALVADLHLAIEVPDSRFQDFTAVGAAALIVDNACARDLVLGSTVATEWRDADLAAHEVMCSVGQRYTRKGIGSNVLGDPRAALTWCVNELSALGVDIAAGEFVTTGTCAMPLEIAPGDVVTADFGAFGAISVRFTD